MATAEVLHPGISRRDLLFPFARKRHSGRKPVPKQAGRNLSHHPEPPIWGDLPLTRRQVIFGGGIIAVGAVGVVAGLLKPWELFHQETLESLVTQAKKMEDEYQDNDLSNKSVREKYADILAGIFALHHPGYLSRQQLKEAVSFTDSLSQFTQQRIISSGRMDTPTPRQIEKERLTTASTDNRRRKITVNVAADGFKQENINLTQGMPPAWNPLKQLRLALFHEFNHLVVEAPDEVIFSMIDPNNRLKDKRIEGFRFVGINERGTFDTALNDLHETIIELLARDLSQSYFGSYDSHYPTEITGEEITVVVSRLEQILQVVGITHQELAILHKNSNLRKFLLRLSDKAGVNRDAPLENRIRFGSIIAGAIENNDQRTLQNYINQVTSR